ncbi:MAG: hypothetical protein WKF89_09645 [Chitinophagaceae bacterium]
MDCLLLNKATKVIQATVLILVLDDATGVGVIDDIAIPVLEIVNGGLLLYDFLTKAEDKTDHMGKPKGNTPGNNQAQNQQVNSLAKKYKLSNDQIEKLHDRISGEGYGYRN